MSSPQTLRQRGTTAAEKEKENNFRDSNVSEATEIDSATDQGGLTDKEKAKIPAPILSPEEENAKKFKAFKERVFWSTVMVLGFATIISMGHFYVAFLVVGLTFGMFVEIIGLKRNVEKDNKLPLFRTLRLYFYLLANYAILKRFLGNSHLDDMVLKFGGEMMYKIFVKYHVFTTYIGFLGGIIGFVLTLRKFSLRYQFEQMGWVFLTIILVVGQSCAHLSNIYSGLVWFLLSTTLVITNDCFAYLVGIKFGRTPLIELSPKKTWEGFIGGGIFTIIWAVIAVNILSRMDFFLCPQPDLMALPFDSLTSLSCDDRVKAQFRETWTMPFFEIKVGMLSVHAFFLSLFASSVAPFGGFFASGFKRAFRLKDFGDLIPGHGGVTDRFDCQIVMGMFCFMYLNTFVYGHESLESIKRAAEMLSPEERRELLNHLYKMK